MANISGNELMDSFDKVLPYLPILFDNDISLSVIDTKKYLKIQNCENLPLKANVGDPVPTGGAAFEALKTGNVIIKDVPKEIYGTAFKSYAIPIKDDDNTVVGVILAGKSLKKRNEVLSQSQDLAASLQQISGAIQEASSGIQVVVGANENILQEVKDAAENVTGTDDILKFVQNVSSQTNLLGLNAAIEAARVGDLGKGFSVVAEEIRKLSSTSNDSIKKIDEVLKKIEKSVINISNKVNESNTVFNAQASAIEEITVSIDKLTSTAQILEELSQKL
nr:methyl-accepting chemotaxis protein [Clostridium ragsdalei]